MPRASGVWRMQWPAFPASLRVEVSLATEAARVQYAPGALETHAIREAVVAAGYDVDSAAETEAIEETLRRRDEEREAEARGLLHRFQIGALLGVPVVIIGHAQFIPGLQGLSPGVMRGLWTLSGFLTIPIMVYVGGRFFTGGWSAFRRHDARHGHAGRSRDGGGVALLDGRRCLSRALSRGDGSPVL